MRKTYINPTLMEITAKPLEMINATGVSGQGTDMGYKGADEDGTVDPEAKELQEEEDFMNMLIEQEFVDKSSLWQFLFLNKFKGDE